MDFKYFSKNGEVLPIEQASVSLSNIEYQYGFGVYENIRLANGVLYFATDHIERLMESARIIGLEHTFSPDFIAQSIAELVGQNAALTCNIKVLLIGPSTSLRAGGEASLNILCLNPLFPDKSLYRGADFITYTYERPFPHAKTLNMLESFIAYREAKKAGAYDALLVDNAGCITEGTRTNFFCMSSGGGSAFGGQGVTIFTPPEEKILLGVTRKAVLKVAEKNGFEITQKDIRVAELTGFDAAFVTSTSSKIVPVRKIGTHVFAALPEPLQRLMSVFDAFLDSCGGVMS